MKLVILDWATMTFTGDLSPTCFHALADEVDCYSTTAPQEVAERIGNAELVLCNKAPITRAVLEACPQIRYIGLFATGYNNVDLQAADDYGITICNAGSYSTNAVAQLVFAYILEHYSKASLYSMDVRLGKWCSSPTFSYFPYGTEELSGKTLGIIGYGSIGRRVAELGAAFHMRPIIATRTAPTDCPYPVVTMDDAFAMADVLTIHCPLNGSTAGLVCAERLELMKETAILINTSRGGVVIEGDLAEALEDGLLAAAYLDVLVQEPMAEDTPLRHARNCFITPHIGWAPLETRQRLLQIVRDNVRAFLSGTPKNQVNKGNAT